MLLKILLVILNLICIFKFIKSDFMVDFSQQNDNQSASEATSLEKFLKGEIRKPWVEKLTEMAEEAGEMKYKLKLQTHLKMMVTTLAAIENTEEKHARNISINIPIEIVDMFERRKEERKQRYSFILKQNTNDIFIENLKFKLRQNGMSVDEFSDQIAKAHHILSQTIQDMVLTPGTYRYLNTQEYNTVRKALRIFMKGFKTRKNITISIF